LSPEAWSIAIELRRVFVSALLPKKRWCSSLADEERRLHALQHVTPRSRWHSLFGPRDALPMRRLLPHMMRPSVDARAVLQGESAR
jgi:hypothetical protein